MHLPSSRRTLNAAALLSLLILAAHATGCEPADPPILGPDTATPQLAKPGACPDHPSCKPEGDPGDVPSGTVDMRVDGLLVVDDQGVDISKDNQATLELQETPGFTGALAYAAAAGSPSTADLGDCVTDPADLLSTDATAVQRLIDRLEDPDQERSTFVAAVERKKGTGRLFQTWSDDGDGMSYRTRLTTSTLLPDLVVSATESGDVLTYTGGSIVSWNTSTNEALACPNQATVVVELTRS